MSSPARRFNIVRATKVVIWVACLMPIALIVARIAGIEAVGGFSANPVQEIVHAMGITALNLLMLTLAVTPLRKLTGQNWLLRVRRLLGLFAFFYLVMHFTAYAALDLRFDFATIGTDIAERPYITIGMLALVMMIPLAVTSTRGWQKRLGRRWTSLHRLVYPIAVLGVVHFWWQVKADIREPLLYAVILSILLGFRVVDSRVRARRRAAAAAAAAAQGSAARA